MSDKVLVAVYGSLRVGMENARVNERAGGVHIGTGKTVENYDLYQYGGGYFPSVSLVHNESQKPVVVDVFETTVAGLEGPYDCLEGHHGNDSNYTFYNRDLVDVELNGEIVKCWIYNIPEVQPNRVESGDWCLFKRPDYYDEAGE